MVFFWGGALHPELYRAWWVLGGWHHTLSYTDHSIFWGWHHNPKPPRAWQSLRAACTAPRAVAGDFLGGFPRSLSCTGHGVVESCSAPQAVPQIQRGRCGATVGEAH